MTSIPPPPCPEGYSLLTKGWTSHIYRHPDPDKVVKVLIDDPAHNYVASRFFEAEKAVYERLWDDSDSVHNSSPTASDSDHFGKTKPPNSVLKCFGPDPNFDAGIVLEYAEKGSLWDYLHEHEGQQIDGEMLVKWARQAAQGLAYINKCGVLHRDIHVTNMFLDNDMNVKIGDFGAASVDGKYGLMSYRVNHQLWFREDQKWKKKAGVQSEVFALGSALWHMVTGKELYRDLYMFEEEELKRKMQEKELPETGDLPVLGDVIEGCWRGKYSSMDEVVADIDRLYPDGKT